MAPAITLTDKQEEILMQVINEAGNQIMGADVNWKPLVQIQPHYSKASDPCYMNEWESNSPKMYGNMGAFAPAMKSYFYNARVHLWERDYAKENARWANDPQHLEWLKANMVNFGIRFSIYWSHKNGGTNGHSVDDYSVSVEIGAGRCKFKIHHHGSTDRDFEYEGDE